MRTHIQSTELGESLLIALSTDTRSTDRAKAVADSGWSKCVWNQVVKARIPGDLAFKRVDHHVAIDGADATVADGDRAGVDGWRKTDREAGELMLGQERLQCIWYMAWGFGGGLSRCVADESEHLGGGVERVLDLTESKEEA